MKGIGERNNMEEWKEYKIYEIADVQTGPFGSQLHNEDYVSEGTPIVTVEHLGSRKFTIQNLPKVSEKDRLRLSKYTMSIGDIIFSRVGSVDRCSYVDLESNGWMFSGRCLRIHVLNQDEVNTLFLYYYFCIQEIKQHLRNIAVGATMPSLNTKLLNNINIRIPSKKCQDTIAKILGSIDDKIELNNRINTNLEEQAQALFRRWFVDFEFPNDEGLPYKSNGGKFVESEHGAIPEGWISGKFTDIINIQGGGTPQTKNSKFWNGYIPFFTPKDVPNVCFTLFTEKQITEEGLKNCNSKFYPKYTVFITARGTVGKVVIAGQNMAMNQSCYALVGKDDNIQYFVYYYTKELIYLLRNKASGAVFDAITTRDFDSDNVVIPPKGIIKKFQNNIEPLMALILNNCKENQGLVQLRDTILPRLMNNQIKI